MSRLWILLLFALPAAAESPLDLMRAQRSFGSQHPDAPAETAQFAFLVGEWDCKTRFLGQDGQTYNEGSATWIGSYVIDGWAIQDFWIGHGPDGPGGVDFHGTNIRSFNPQTGKWDNRWLSAGNNQWKYYESEQQGDSMVMTGGEGSGPRGDFIDRNSFYEIGEDSWRWRKDRSWDGGETWFEGIGYIEATRAN